MKPLVLIWGGLLFGVLAFLGIAYGIGPGLRSQLPEPFVWVMLAMAVSSAVSSRVVPRFAKGNAMSKAIIGFALAEAACLVSGVAWLLTSDTRCLAGVGLGFLALASLYPRDGADGETVRLMPP